MKSLAGLLCEPASPYCNYEKSKKPPDSRSLIRKNSYIVGIEIDLDCWRRLDTAREYLEQARVAESPDVWREWARRLLRDVPGFEAETLRDEC